MQLETLPLFYIVMGHSVAWSYPNWNEVCIFNQSQLVEYMAGSVMWQVIYTFHMALFFMVSGFLLVISLVMVKFIIETEKQNITPLDSILSDGTVNISCTRESGILVLVKSIWNISLCDISEFCVKNQ